MCQYCEVGISFVNTNIVRMAVDYTIGIDKNLRVDCFDATGKEIIIPFKIKLCPMCGKKL